MHSKALITSKTTSKIPKVIWQTNYTNRVTLPVYLNYLLNRMLSLDWEYRYVSTEERLEFIKSHAPDKVVNAFEQLLDGASQADLWRLCVLNQQGGVYMDIDAHFVWPLSKIIKADDEEMFLMTKENGFTNYFMASAPTNKHIEKALEIVVGNIENKKIEAGVFGLTGPTALNLALANQHVNQRLYKITCSQGGFTNEYFQYMDKPKGKWTHVDKSNLLKSTEEIQVPSDTHTTPHQRFTHAPK